MWHSGGGWRGDPHPRLVRHRATAAAWRMERRPLVILHVNGRGGKLIDIHIYENDDPSVVGKQFLEDQNLPLQLLPIIVQKIVDSVLEASRKKIGNDDPSLCSPDIHRSRTASIAESSPEEVDYHRMRDAYWSPSSNNTADRLVTPRSRSLSVGSRNHGASEGRKALRQQEYMQSLYNSASKYDQHKMDLKAESSVKREKSVLDSDFRVQLQNRSPLMWEAHRSHGKRVSRGSDFFDGLYRDYEERAARQAKMTEKVEQQRLAMEQDACKFVPELATSLAMQRSPSLNRSALFNDLYEHSAIQRVRLQRARSEELRATSPSFSPTICKRSAQLAQQRLGASRSRPLLKSHNSGGPYIAEARTAAPTPATEFRPLSEGFDSSPLARSDQQSAPSQRSVRRDSPSSPSSQSIILHSRSRDVPLVTGAPLDGHPNLHIDESAVQRLRELGALSSCSTGGTAALYSPYSHRRLPTMIPAPATEPAALAFPAENDDDMHATATAMSPLSDNSSVFGGGLSGDDAKLRGCFDASAVAEYNDFPTPNVFERLYQEGNKQARNRCIAQHQPTHSHRPNLGPNSGRTVEADPDAFFQRLYDHREKQIDAQIQRHIGREVALAANQRSMTPQQRAATVERLYGRKDDVPKQNELASLCFLSKRRQMSSQKHVLRKSDALVRQRQAQSLAEIFDVLLVTAQFRKDEEEHVRKKAAGARGDAREEGKRGEPAPPLLKMDPPPAAAPVKSTDSAVQASCSLDLSDAEMTLGEIVGENSLASIALRRSERSEPIGNSSASPRASASTAAEGGEAKAKDTSDRLLPAVVVIPVASPPRGAAPVPVTEAECDVELLDTAAADPSLLEPYLLCTTIRCALDALRPRHVSKKQFVASVLGMMATSQLPPLSYLLTVPEKRFRRKLTQGRSYLSEYAAQAQDCTHSPALCEQSQALARDRYRAREQGKERVEETLRNYGQRYKEHHEELKAQWDAHEFKECTFKPQSIALYMREARESVQRIRRQQSQSQSQQVGAGSCDSTTLSSRSSVAAVLVPAMRRIGWAPPPDSPPHPSPLPSSVGEP